MGRFTAYDQNGRMVADFDKSDYDFLCRYGRTPEEVLDENEKLRQFCARLSHGLNLGGKWCEWACKVEFGCNMDENCPVERELRELGIEVKP